MTGFAEGAFLKDDTNSTVIAQEAFSKFFVPNGLPRLAMLDDDNNFKGQFIKLCESIGIACHAVSPGNHRAVLNERFHRYLNKVQKSHAADCQSLTKWIMGALFALCAWNASPIDGTNIIRSFAAKGREFPFPIDLPESNTASREHICQGDQIISHVDAVFRSYINNKSCYPS